MAGTMELSGDRIRKITSDKVNQRIDRKTEENIRKYSTRNTSAMNARIRNLNNEWDVERSLEITSGLNILTGLILGLTVNKKWFLLSAISAAFLVQHSIQGWCPPLPVLRRLGIRTHTEIDQEREALMDALVKEYEKDYKVVGG